jgi:Immunity protein 63
MSAWAASAAGFGPLEIALAALVALVGALLIHNLGRGRGASPSLEGYNTQAPAPAVGTVKLPQVGLAMRAAAALMDLPDHLLPALSLPTGGEGDFVYGEGGGYVYASYERGTALFEHRTADLDDLLYRVLKDRAWTRTYLDLMGQDLSPEDHAARLAAGQIALLARAHPGWAERARGEAARP